MKSFTESMQSFEISHNMPIYLKYFINKQYCILEICGYLKTELSGLSLRAFSGSALLKNIDLSHSNPQFIRPTIFLDIPGLETVYFRRNPLLHSPGSSRILASRSIVSLDLSEYSLTSGDP